MEFRTYRITRDDSERRIDRVARRFLPDISLSGIYKLLRKGLIRIDGKRVSPDFHVSEGNNLEIAALIEVDARKTTISPSCPQMTGEPDIILETQDLLFVYKPVGIPVHGEKSLAMLIAPSIRAMESLSFRSGPLHRLDCDTSGIITFSRSLEGARWFSAAINEHRFEKHYLGIARGNLVADAEWLDRNDDGKEMITIACPVVHSKATIPEQFTLVRYRIVTGRKHQIRIQTARHGHPLAEDRQYDVQANPLCDKKNQTYFLHAWQLLFPDDRLEGVPSKLVAPIPALFREKVLQLFGESSLAHIDSGELYWNEHDELQ